MIQFVPNPDRYRLKDADGKEHTEQAWRAHYNMKRCIEAGVPYKPGIVEPA